MKKLLKNQKGFTLIEMMIVMLIISVLLAITIPNLSQHSTSINKKGCQAYKKMVEAQVEAYEMDKGVYPNSISQLVAAGYLPEGAGGCPGGKTEIIVGTGGVVSEQPKTQP